MVLKPRPAALSLAALLLLAATVQGADWKLCGCDSAVNVTQVEVIPDPPVAGLDATFVLTAELSAAVGGGQLRASVKCGLDATLPFDPPLPSCK
jgi:hypothetical protein